jgi:hypothetical protein
LKRSDFSDGEWGAILQRRWDALAQAHGDGLIDEHPLEGFNRDSAALRRAARDNAANEAQDDPLEFPGKLPNPERSGASLARGMDSIPGYDRLGGNRRDSTRTVDADLIVRRPPLSGDHRVVDEDGIVQSKRSW